MSWFVLIYGALCGALGFLIRELIQDWRDCTAFELPAPDAGDIPEQGDEPHK